MNTDWKKRIPDWVPTDRSIVGVLITLLALVIALYLGYVLWMLYMRSPGHGMRLCGRKWQI